MSASAATSANSTPATTPRILHRRQDSGGGVSGGDSLDLHRSQWEARVMKKHPDVLELRERMRCLNGNDTFGRTLGASKTDVSEPLSEATITGLIVQYLAAEGLDNVVKTLQKESDISMSASSRYSPDALVVLLKMGIKSLDSNILYNPPPPPPPTTGELDPDVRMYQEYIDANHNDEDEDKDISVLEEASSGCEGTLIVEGRMRAGTFNKLSVWLMSAHTDLTYRRIFFTTYTSFSTSERLFNKLLQIYEDGMGDVERKPEKDHASVVTILRYWLDRHPADFSDKLLGNINTFIENTLVHDGHAGWAKQLRGAAAKVESHLAAAKNTALDGAHPHTAKDAMPASSSLMSLSLTKTDPPEPKVPRNIFSPTLTLDDVDEEEVARQLCIIDAGFYSKLCHSEFLSKAWLVPHLRPRAPNLLAFLRRFSDLSKWVSANVLAEKKLRPSSHKPRVVPRFLKICEHLRAMNNFNSLMAIYAGISNASVFYIVNAMKKDIHYKQLEVLTDLEYLFSSAGSYGAYRQAYASAKSPCIPNMAVHLQDILFLEDGQPDRFKGNVINFAKREVILSHIDSVLHHQKALYNYCRVHQVQVFLADFKLDSEKTLYDRGLDLAQDL